MSATTPSSSCQNQDQDQDYDADAFGSRYRMPTAAQRAQAKRLVALYDYEPTLNDTDIRLTRGEVVFGVELQGEWWWGYNTKRSGIFPANFVQEDGAMAQAANSSSNGAEEEQEEQEDVIRCQAGNPSSDGGADGEAAGPPPSPPRTRRGRSNGPGASGGAAAAKAEEEEEEEDGSEGGPDPFSGEVDDEEVSPPTQKFEHKQQQSTLHSIPGLNVQWVISDNLKCAHTLLLWNGNFSNFVKSKLLLTDNFLVEAVYFTPDLPEVSVYPLHKLYIDPRQKIDAGFLKRGYLTFRSQYYFCNLSTTAFGGGHNELVTTLRERSYTYAKTSQMKGKQGAQFLRTLLKTLLDAKQSYNSRFVNYIRSLPGYEQLYDPSPPHFDRKIKDLVFATDISKMMVDCFVSYDELKFVLD